MTPEEDSRKYATLALSLNESKGGGRRSASFSTETKATMINLLFTVIFLAVHLNAPTSNVYVGSEGQTVIRIETAKIGQLLDIVYNESNRQLYIYSELADGQHVTRWNRQGRLLIDWHLPSFLRSSYPFYLTNGNIALFAGDDKRKRPVAIYFPARPPYEPRIKDEDKVSFSPASDTITEQIRAIMRKLDWLPLGEMADHILYDERLINDFSPVLPSLEEHIAWTEDFSVVSHAWHNAGQFHLAVKNEGSQTYVNRDTSERLFAALDWTPGPRDRVELYAINVSHTMAVYGLGIQQGDTKQAVVWVDCRGKNWRVSRTEPGYLARTPVKVSD